MFAEKFLPLIARHPEEASALRRVAAYFEGIESRHGLRVYNVRLDSRMLFDISKAGSKFRVARVASILIEEGILERRVVVRTSQGQGVEFHSYEEIPDVIRDPVLDVDMVVSDENLEASYVVVSNGLH